MFLPHTCDIYRLENTTVNGATRKSKAQIYSGISCMFYKKKAISQSDTELSRETDVSEYDVILDSGKTQIREGYIVELIDGALGSLGEYLIQAINPNYSVRSNSLDNLHFTCKKL